LTNMAAAKLTMPIANYAYTVGATGNRLTASETVSSGATPITINRVYSYDDLYRLTAETIQNAGQIGDTHDAVGNRLSRSSTLPEIPLANYGYDANDRLLTDQYDANGNTVAGSVSPSMPVVSDTYDFEDRLISRNSGYQLARGSTMCPSEARTL